MKTLEGTVLEALAQLGETETIGLETVDPHQFLGIELNVRAAAIAELVLWIGYLQQHYRNRSEHPAEPILKAFGNIQQKDAVLTWDGYPEMQFERRDGEAVQVFPNARRPDWPEAEFIVGNPPFIGKGKDLRLRLGDAYAEALWGAHPQINQSADLVVYWWDRAADILTRKKTLLRRFGLVTTNSITQVLQRRVVERHLGAKLPISIVYAVPAHPWTKATKDAAAVRIAMTVAQQGRLDGTRVAVRSESGLHTDTPELEFDISRGRINADLSIGSDVTTTSALQANQGLCTTGVIFLGDGFLLSPAEVDLLRTQDGPAASGVIRKYLSGRDFNGRTRGLSIIDLDGFEEAEARRAVPQIYQRLLETVKADRQQNREPYRRDFWWLFARKNTDLRAMIDGMDRFVVTTLTSKHRFFGFLEGDVLPDQTLVAIGSGEGHLLASLSSKHHLVWTLHSGGTLEDRPRYNKVVCFDPFPFPDPDEATRARLRALGEELDATRKTVQGEHPDLTLTGLYNVLEKVRAGAELTAAEADVKARGRVLILKDLHEQIDRATADAYGWPHDLTDEQILEKLVALNAERAAEEATGHVRWLRPDYQIPRFAKGAAAPRTGELDLGAQVVAIGSKKDGGLPAFPKDKGEQVMAIRAVLQASSAPMDAAAVARAFKGGGRKIELRVVQALNTLVRYAEITALADGRFAARRAA
jgi:hypothetical protein